MITSLSRILKYGLQNFVRNGWLSVATIAIMVLTLLVFLSLAFFDVISKTAIISLQDKIDISVYFKHDVPEEQVLDLSEEMELLDEVKSVEYVSQDKALAIFKEEHKDDDDRKQTKFSLFYPQSTTTTQESITVTTTVNGVTQTDVVSVRFEE